MVRYIIFFMLSLGSLGVLSSEEKLRKDFLIESFNRLNSEDLNLVNKKRLVEIYEENKEVNYPYGIALMMYYFSKEEYSKVAELGDEIKELCMPVCYNSYNNSLLTYSVLGKLTSVFFSRYGYSLHAIKRWGDAKDVIALGVETQVLRKISTYSHFLSILSEASINVKDYGAAERYLFLLKHFAKSEGTQSDYEKTTYEIAKLEVIRGNYNKAGDMIFKIIDNAELMKMLKEDTVFSEYIESESYKKIISSSNEKISSGEG